jgi:hypothetical protein
MRHILATLTFVFTMQVSAQIKQPEDVGFRHIQTLYKGDTVDILIKSKEGDELKRKPIFLFCQGSLPTPLIITTGELLYGVFPFNTDSLCNDYHLAIVGKPFIPLVADVTILAKDFTYHDPKTGNFPKEYSKRNLPAYYVNRDLQVIDFLMAQSFTDPSKFVVAGHSEGSAIAVRLAAASEKVTHLIYSSGNPLGRILAMVEEQRVNETDTDSTKYGEHIFDYWKEVVNDKTNMSDTTGDTYKATYDFSLSQIKDFERLKIPVLICYGTKDASSTFNDYLRIEMIRQGRTNFSYSAYIGLDHNFFPLKPSGEPDHSKYNWDKVALDWQQWLNKN